MHSKRSPAAFVKLCLEWVMTTVFLLPYFQCAQAQRVFVQPQSNYGGQLVQQLVPHQPSAAYPSEAQLDLSPIYLDQCPEFCSPAIPVEGEPIILQQTAPTEPNPLPPGFRNGLFQKLFFTGTYIPQFEGDSLGFGDLEAGAVFGLPFSA